jgi:alpha-beta hydrolase superfamily lysophospholipase
MGFDRQMSLASPSGATLFLRVKQARAAPRAVIQINHGMAEHGARYARLGEAAAAAGFAVYVHDQRGHGATTAPDAPAGRFAARDGVAKVIADVAAVHDLIRREHPGVPVICLGHSMGAAIALAFALEHSARIAGLALWNGNFSPGPTGRLARWLLDWERLRLGSDAPSRIAARLAFRAWARSVPDRRTDFDWLSHDAAEVDTYIRDPLCGWDASVGMWRDAKEMVFRGADDRRLSTLPRDLPINLVGGGHDPVTEGGRAVRRFARRLAALGFTRIASTIYPENRHESLNEINRDRVTAEFLAWAAEIC